MLMAAVVPRDTVVTYKPPRGTKVNLSTANHVALADTGSPRVKGDLVPEEDRSLSLPTRGRSKSPLVQHGPAATRHLITAELNHCTGSLSSLCHANSNGLVAHHMARPAFTRSATLRSSSGPLRSSSISGALDRPASPGRPQRSFSRTPSAGSDTNDSRQGSITSIATDELTMAVPVEDEEEEKAEEKLLKNPRVVMLKSNSLTFTPVIVPQQPPQRDQHVCPPRPLTPTTVNLQQRRPGLMVDPTRRATYRANKSVSFDCETRTETFETEMTESETDEREFVQLMGHYDRRPHVRLPMSHDDEYCPPGKEEQDFLPKVLCFALALVITGGILYGLNVLISRMNMNLFSA